MPCSCSGSAMMSATFQRGLRLAYGSWKIIWMLRRRWCPSLPRKAACASCPLNRKRPRVGWYSPTSTRATVLLPQPDSPTSASVWPAWMLKLASSTACSNWRGLPSSRRLSSGGETSKVRARASACTSGWVAPAGAAAGWAGPASIRAGCSAADGHGAPKRGLVMPPPPAAHAASTRPGWRRPAADRAARRGSARTRAGSAD